MKADHIIPKLMCSRLQEGQSESIEQFGFIIKAGCAKMSPTAPLSSCAIQCGPICTVCTVYCSLHVHQCPNKSHSSVQKHHITKITLWFPSLYSASQCCRHLRDVQTVLSLLFPNSTFISAPTTPIHVAHSVTVSSLRTSAGLSTSTWRMSDREMMPSMLEHSSTTTKR